MKRRFASAVVLLAAAVVLVLATAIASAQNAARVQIPFAFTANHQTMPAGQYRVSLQAENYLTLVSCDTGKVVGLLVRSTDAHQPIKHGGLVFYSGHRGYTLTQVRFAFTNVQSDLAVRPKAELEMAWDSPSHTVEIAMR